MNRAELPADVRAALSRAYRLEWVTLGVLATIVAAMYWAMGSSQAMKTAWIEDMLSLLPPAFFLISSHLEFRRPTRRFPYGFHRAGSLAFFGAALALTAVGGFLLYDAGHTLLTVEKPTLGAKSVFGHDIWLGWAAVAALLYSVVPPVILGRMKRPLARKLADKVLYTDADMNAADWQTGLAGIAGIFGLALGFWWADAAAAGLIAFSVLKDGLGNLARATAELIDGAPRALESQKIAEEAETVMADLSRLHSAPAVRVRETGRYLRAELVRNDGANRGGLSPERHWRLIDVAETARDPHAGELE